MSGYRPSKVVRTWQYVAAGFIAAMAAVGSVGWLIGARSLAGQISDYVPMVPVTALCLALLAFALTTRVASSKRGVLAVSVLATVITLAVLELADAFTGLHVAPERIFAAASELIGARQPGRMSPPVALCLILLAGALLLSRSSRPRVRWSSQILALAVGNVGFVLCVGYAYGTPLFYSLLASPPALPTSIGLTVLGVAIALQSADRLPLRIFLGDSVRAQLLRAVLPTLGAVIIAIGILDISNIRSGSVQNPMITSELYLLAIGAVSVMLLRSATRVGRRLDASDEARRLALADLAASNTSLEHMVHDVAGAMGRIGEARDPYTQGHEERVAALARLIAEDLGLPRDAVEGIEMAGLLHDIGKLRVPTEILSKPGRLSEVEFALIKEHCAQGYEILKDIAFPWAIAETVLQHHERADGSGYPRGLRGDEILPAARILAVADVVEAMASYRPYRPALGIEAAIAEIRDGAGRYDAAVAASCIGLYERGALSFEATVRAVPPEPVWPARTHAAHSAIPVRCAPVAAILGASES